MKQGVIAAGILAVGGLVLAATSDKAVMNLLILVLLYSYWGVAWNIAAGMTGLMSLGHALFAGTGAYAVAYLYSAFGLNPWVSALIGMAIAALQAAAIGVLTFRFRVKGHYFGLLTLACAEIAYLAVSASQPLGRSDGITLEFGRWGWTYLQFREKWPYMLIALAMLAGILILTHTLLSRRVGYYWRALRDNEEAAEALGVPAFKYKLIAIVSSAALTALGGAFYAQYISFVDPRSVLGIDLSVQILVFCIVGGLHSVWGPVLGAALLLPLGEAVRAILGTSMPGSSAVMYALVLIFVALRLPMGLTSLRLPRKRPGASSMQWRKT